MMGAALSAHEEQELTSHLLGIQPTSLAAIIWDTINNVGVDDDVDKFGINFEGDGEVPKVMFWDNGEAAEMPRKVFLEILEMVSGRIIEAYESDYNLEKSPELKSGVDKLTTARTQLQKEIGLLKGTEGACDYRSRLDSIKSVESEHTAEEMVQGARQRRSSMSWAQAGQASIDGKQRKLSNRGLEAVVDRLPELRRRYEAATKRNSISTVRNKILALGIFGSKIHPQNSFKEEDEEYKEEELPAKNYTRQRSQTLLVSHVQRSSSIHSMKSQTSLNLPDVPSNSFSKISLAPKSIEIGEGGYPNLSMDSSVDIP